MPTAIPKNRKLKRATMLVRKMKCIRSISNVKKKSYKLLYEKLKSNNQSLALALSKEKEDNKTLFSQNIALIAENQDLEVACNRRDSIILNMMQNSKEALKMLVQTTGYVTNNITLYQEFLSSHKEIQTPNYSTDRNDLSLKKFSERSPTKGVVKPMVSGHTITKPTINLSRVNIQRPNDVTNLSIIAEISTASDRSPNTDEDDEEEEESSPVPAHRNRYEGTRPCRLPERLTISSPRQSDEIETQLTSRSSRKGSRKRSNRLSGSIVTENDVRRDSLGSPCVKLNDVSKLLRNSHRINVQKLLQMGNSIINDTSRNSIDVSRNNSKRNIISEDHVACESLKNLVNTETNDSDDEFDDDDDKDRKKSNKKQDQITTTNDPLEGSSWMYNDSQMNSLSSLVSPDHKKKSHSLDQDSFFLNDSQSVERSSPNSEENRYENSEVDGKVSFVTQRRGHEEITEEDTDDFTLMYRPPPSYNRPFGLNDLDLPVLPEPIITSKIKNNANESDDQITTTINRITQDLIIPSIRNNTFTENGLDNSTVKLPLYASIMEQTKRNDSSGESLINRINDLNEETPSNNKKTKRKKKSSNDKDPSTVKVVLQKLNEKHVKKKTHRSKMPQGPDSPIMLWMKGSSENIVCSSDSDSSSTSRNRPKRSTAPVNLREPNLIKKLRRGN